MALVRARFGMATATRVIPGGAHLEDTDPAVVANPHYFERIGPAGETLTEPVVEQATAAPGEKRTTRRSKATTED